MVEGLFMIFQYLRKALKTTHHFNDLFFLGEVMKGNFGNFGSHRSIQSRQSIKKRDTNVCYSKSKTVL